MRPSSPTAPACVDHPALFQHPLLEEPPSSRDGADLQARARLMAAKAANLCQTCPLMQQCLFEAVVKHDVSGFAAGTTQSQRAEIRARLGVSVAREDFDTLAGVTRAHRQVDHEEVVRLRAANPHESLEVIAMRLGCSLSTVKRHMRKARQGTKPSRALDVIRPTMERVMQAYLDVTRPRRARTDARVA